MSNELLFKNRFRIPSTRWKGWNYSWDGYYFITICTKNRFPYFGNITNGKMYLSSMGEIIHNCWLEIPNHFFNVVLDRFVVMPDHFHGIIQIKNGRNMDTPPVETLHCNVSTIGKNATNVKNNFSHISPKHGSISTIIRSFKSICTKQIRLSGLQNFSWQTRYHDRIIRNEFELNCIRQYIRNNPKNWGNKKILI